MVAKNVTQTVNLPVLFETSASKKRAKERKGTSATYLSNNITATHLSSAKKTKKKSSVMSHYVTHQINPTAFDVADDRLCEGNIFAENPYEVTFEKFTFFRYIIKK